MTTADAPRRAYSPKEAGVALGVSERTVTYLLSDGTLPSVKLGRRRLIRAEHIDALLDALEAFEAGEANGEATDIVVGLAAKVRAHEERLAALEARLAQGEAS